MTNQNPLRIPDLEASGTDDVSSITAKDYVSIRCLDLYPDNETQAETKARLKHTVRIQRDSYGSGSEHSG
jgi:hypothetical protein